MKRFSQILSKCGISILGMSSSLLFVGNVTPILAETVTAQSGQVKAELTWSHEKSSHLQIERNEQTIFQIAQRPSPWPQRVKEISYEEFVETPINQLPRGVKLWDGNYRRGSVKVARVDINDDSLSELIVVYDDTGSGGYSYGIYQNHNGQAREIGSIFGLKISLLAKHNGYHQMETWGQSGSAYLYRHLYTFNGKQYCEIRVDEFEVQTDGELKFINTDTTNVCN